MKVPRDIRPTGSKVREALFSIWGPRLRGARFLDLFAGSGAVGLEALSRGAASACFLEADPSAVRIIEENCRALGVAGWSARVADLLAAAGSRWSEKSSEKSFDLAFADPPYAVTDLALILSRLEGWLDEGGAVAFEHSSRLEPPQGAGAWVLTDSRTYGESALAFYAQGS